MQLKWLTAIALVCLANSGWGCFSSNSGDTRVIKGNKDDPFSYKTTLPGNYTRLESGIHSVTFADGICSTPFFNCTYELNDDSQMTLEMKGYMSSGLKWVTFFGDDLIPISIVFFTNYIWNDLASGSIQPQYGVPLIVRAKGFPSVTLTCSIFSTTASFSLYTGLNKTLYYSSTVDKTKDYPQIWNLEPRNILLHKVITLTVLQKDPVDYYACNTGKYWLTHTVDWTQVGSKASVLKTSVPAVAAVLIYAGS